MGKWKEWREKKSPKFSRNLRSLDAGLLGNFKPHGIFSVRVNTNRFTLRTPVLSLYEGQETLSYIAAQLYEEHGYNLKQCVRTKSQLCVQKVLPHKRALTKPETNPHASICLRDFLFVRRNQQLLAHTDQSCWSLNTTELGNDWKYINTDVTANYCNPWTATVN